ncbi:hypothetical protein TBLA_0A10040 [Henningerozyma blattae CBS 6284]|uniref:Glucosidase II subunit alpha n=1 Tax=Henningerozyma blattae (strain ATCC 34711 / CBS 6284 / DSM 70876 / NBRC 10599 / NRRL Y-10934 / UCD 77-7) TaxID=1071380 RepID=I2GXD2_HENB6|nr:hypothetical protein TBLA_0A10040 [Tetrapisispora blattae CBS 6284]CCH58784.1 hypothetical protein TBLA_0A10040 [Tetrapisispora blattae CBS 6284]
MLSSKRLICLSLLVVYSFAFTDYLLKKCGESGFCNRNRFYSNNILNSKNNYYSLDETSLNFDSNSNILYANVIKTIPSHQITTDNDTISHSNEELKITLPITISMLDSAVRFTMDEARSERHDVLEDFSSDLLSIQRYNETSNWSFDPKNNIPIEKFLKFNQLKNIVEISNEDESIKLNVYQDQFKIEIFYKGKLAMVLNDRLFLNVEHLRNEDDNDLNLLPEESSFNSFEDNFQYSKDDTLPFGPESVALDFTLIDSTHVYGIPEHADSLLLKDTSGSEPYRLYNVDVFEYNLDSKMPMYGAIPLLIGLHNDDTHQDNQFVSGVFWNNAADTWIDINYNNDLQNTKTHWMSESGIIDTIIFFTNSPLELSKKFTDLTGKPALPLLSSIGYHQCRWNYNDELDVLTVDSEMDRNHIPYDFIWLDLEYTDDRKYFTWKPNSFPNPKRLLQKLQRLGRNLVVLIDPHIKNDYPISNEMIVNDVAVKNHKGTPFIGICWPGKSLWIDTFNQLGQKIWNEFFQKFLYENVNNLFIWNDMNEPSIFDGPETSAPKDLIHSGGFEERSVHNVYGLTVHESTYESVKQIYSKSDRRPFILTRSFFAGSQRTAAVWTGDNVATWDYLRMSIPMMLTNGIAGFPFIGSDVAGFSGDPEMELIARWYQAGMWYPFFRAHAHIDSKRREPYLFNEPLKSIVRDIIQLRYKLLPTLYTLFHESSVKGVPIVTPMFYNKPQYKELYSIDDQFYMGDSGILVKPIVEKKVEQTEMIFTPGIYYEYYSLTPMIIDELKWETIITPLNRLPFFIEGGHIITTRDKYRRSSLLMQNDPFSLIVAPSMNGAAQGKIYLDDGNTFEYLTEEYLDFEFEMINGNKIIGKLNHLPKNLEKIGNLSINKIIIAKGQLAFNQETVTIKQNDSTFTCAIINEENRLVILNPGINLINDWEIIF